MHAVDAGLLVVGYLLEILFFFLEVVRDKKCRWDEKDPVLDILPEVFGHHRDEVHKFLVLSTLLCHRGHRIICIVFLCERYN